MSRVEEILQSIIDSTEYTKEPYSRNEYLLLKLKEVIEGGGSGGTGNYNLLINLPMVNDRVLKGNKSFEDLGLRWVTPDVIADEFDETKTYSENDFIIYNSELYKCLSEHSGTWDASDFEKTAVMDSISSGGGVSGNIVNTPTDEEIAASIAEIWGGD